MTDTTEKTSEIIVSRVMASEFFKICKKYSVADCSITVQPNFNLMLFGYVNGDIVDGTPISAHNKDFEVAMKDFMCICMDSKTLKAEKIKQLQEKIKILEEKN